jgi:leucyl-tRNA synthetase
MEKGVHPGGWTRENIANMKAQLKRLGFALDWSREIATCEPEYYGHEQALFLDLYAAGLVYRKESAVNWDPIDHTVLANEQVIDGRGWRSGALVEKRKLNQWFLKITDFADELLEGLGSLEQVAGKGALMQENWIGKSQGLQFAFDISNGESLDVYTTRPDTIFGASFVAVAADHPMAQGVAAGNQAAQDFIALCKQGGTTAAELETAEKLGFDTGLTARHPFTGAALPVYIANFVLMDYGTGAIMAVPGMTSATSTLPPSMACRSCAWSRPMRRDAGKPFGAEAEAGDGILVNSQFLDGMSVADAKRAVIDRAQAEGWGEGRRCGACATGASAASAIGARRSPSCIAKSAAWCRCPRSTARHAARGRRFLGAGQSARSPSDLEARRLPAVRPRRAARDRHARHLRRVRGISCALPASPPIARSIRK